MELARVAPWTPLYPSTLNQEAANGPPAGTALAEGMNVGAKLVVSEPQPNSRPKTLALHSSGWSTRKIRDPGSKSSSSAGRCVGVPASSATISGLIENILDPTAGV